MMLPVHFVVRISSAPINNLALSSQILWYIHSWALARQIRLNDSRMREVRKLMMDYEISLEWGRKVKTGGGWYIGRRKGAVHIPVGRYCWGKGREGYPRCGEGTERPWYWISCGIFSFTQQDLLLLHHRPQGAELVPDHHRVWVYHRAQTGCTWNVYKEHPQRK